MPQAKSLSTTPQGVETIRPETRAMLAQFFPGWRGEARHGVSWWRQARRGIARPNPSPHRKRWGLTYSWRSITARL